MSYRDAVVADMRLVMLRILAVAPGYEANASVLRMALDDYGHKVSHDSVQTELSWLQEQGLARTRQIGGAIVIVELTERGLDAAQGRCVVPGVERPAPEKA